MNGDMTTTTENMTPEGDEVLRRIDAVLQAVSDLSESQAAVNEQIFERLDRTDERLAKIDERFDRTDERLAKIDKRFDRTDERLAKIDERFDRTDERLAQMGERFDRSDGRFDKIEIHLGYLRGTHAANTMRRNASLIADDMGFQIISILPREELIGFAKIAHDAGKSENDVRSFREADMVMLVRDGNGQPAYIAVEASFTVANADISRAKRNAEYLMEFTGLPAKGVVAGVDIGTVREQNAAADGVYCYRIPTRELEAD